MAIYAKACREIISACGLMTLYTIEYSLCWKTLTLVTTIEIKIITNNGHMHNRNKSIMPSILQIRILPKICDIV